MSAPVEEPNYSGPRLSGWGGLVWTKRGWSKGAGALFDTCPSAPNVFFCRWWRARSCRV